MVGLLIALFLSTGTTSPKTRITKSNTMSNATGRAMIGQPTSHRKSAYETGAGGAGGKLTGSNDKTNQLGGGDPRLVRINLVCQVKGLVWVEGGGVRTCEDMPSAFFCSAQKKKSVSLRNNNIRFWQLCTACHYD